MLDGFVATSHAIKHMSWQQLFFSTYKKFPTRTRDNHDNFPFGLRDMLRWQEKFYGIVGVIYVDEKGGRVVNDLWGIYVGVNIINLIYLSQAEIYFWVTFWLNFGFFHFWISLQIYVSYVYIKYMLVVYVCNKTIFPYSNFEYT